MQAKIFFFKFNFWHECQALTLEEREGDNKKRVKDDGFKIVVITLEATPDSRLPLHQINQLELEVSVGRGGAGAKKLYTNFRVTPTKVELELELGCDNNINSRINI